MPSPDTALAILAGLVTDTGARWGETADPRQVADARAVLDLAGPRRHYLTRPRGGRKTTDQAGVAIAALLEQLPDRSRSFIFAADREQAGITLDQLGGFVDRTAGLSALHVGSNSVTNSQTAASITVMSSDDASAYGLIPHMTICDEFAAWPETPGPSRLWSAIFSGLPKVATSRLVVITSAGIPGTRAHKTIERARVSDEWRVSEWDGPLPWVSESDLAEQRAELTESQFARLHMNRWTEGESSLTTWHDLKACVGHSGVLAPVPGVMYLACIDIGIVNDRSVVAIGHLEDDRVAVDSVKVWAGSRTNPTQLSDVEDYVIEMHRSYRYRVLADPAQFAGSLQRLRARGITADQFNFTSTSNSRLALALHTSIRDRRVVLPDDEFLLKELSQVKLVDTSATTVRMDHARGQHDDQAVAVGLLVLTLLETPRPGAEMMAIWRRQLESSEIAGVPVLAGDQATAAEPEPPPPPPERCPGSPDGRHRWMPPPAGGCGCCGWSEEVA